jgi:hypothetical protein
MDRKVRIVTAGIDAASMAKLADDAGGGRVEVAALADMKAAKLVKKGAADYYLGTCWSGGGAALAAATAVLGSAQVVIAGTPGNSVTEAGVVGYLEEGRVAFGFPYEQSKQAIPIIVGAILKHVEAKAATAA